MVQDGPHPSDARPVVVAVGPDPALAAVAFAVEEARRLGCEVHLLHVLHPVPQGPETVLVQAVDVEEAGRARVREAVEQAQDLAGEDVAVSGRLLVGGVVRQLVGALADPERAQMVVVEHRDLSRVRRLVARSTTRALATRLRTPLVAVPTGWSSTRSRSSAPVVTVGVDEAEHAGGLLQAALAAAAHRGARLDVVHAWGLPGMEDDPERARALGRAGADEQEARLNAALSAAGAIATDVRVTVHSPLGPAAERLVEASSVSDLLVLGRHDPGSPWARTWARWWGRCCARRAARCSWWTRADRAEPAGPGRERRLGTVLPGRSRPPTTRRLPGAPVPDLSAPLVLPSGLRLANRLVKAAMTENLADADNQPTAAHERLYRRWARGGSGLLVTGNLMVDRRFLERSRNIVADEHLDVDRLARVRAAAAGVPVIAQLNHPGRQTNRFVSREPVAPSEGGAVKMLGLFRRPRALSAAEVEDVVAAFGSAAARCERAGLDGVQVHAAHGYLLAQFLSPAVNRRTDRWGGDVAGRSRALLAAVRAVRRATGDASTVSVKLNSSDFRHGGFTEDDAEEVVRLLVEEGVDLLEISGGTYENPALFGVGVGTGADPSSGPTAGGPSAKEAYFAAFAARARSAAGQVPVMLTGGIRTRATMQALLDSGTVDLIGLGRPLAIDPELSRALLAGADGVELPVYRLPTVAGVAGESEWYETQLGRIGAGRDVAPGLGAVRAASGFVVGEAVRGIRERRRRLGVAATSRM